MRKALFCIPLLTILLTGCGLMTPEGVNSDESFSVYTPRTERSSSSEEPSTPSSSRLTSSSSSSRSSSEASSSSRPGSSAASSRETSSSSPRSSSEFSQEATSSSEVIDENCLIYEMGVGGYLVSCSWTQSYVGSIEVPAYVNETPVIGVKESGFQFSKFTSITLPNTIQSIGDQAFLACTNLVTFVVPEGVTTVGSGVWNSCSALLQISFPTTLASIGENNFQYDYGLLEIINLSSTKIDAGFFAFSVQYLNDYADSTLVFGSDGFVGQLQNGVNCLVGLADPTWSGPLHVPSRFQRIASYGLFSCAGALEVTMADTVTSIGNCAFYSCSQMISIEIPDSVKEIGSGAFMTCMSVSSLRLPTGLKTITSNSIQDMDSLSYLSIPATVETIETYALNRLGNLHEIEFRGTMSQWSKIDLKTSWNNENDISRVVCTDGVASLA